MGDGVIRRVLITGATGFMGSRLCEVLLQSKTIQPRAFIHSTSSAARIARYPLEFVVGDLADFAMVEKAMEGCDAVVHLARGDEGVMIKGLDNILKAAREHGVGRFVHMSSVAVYGNSPPQESRWEEAVPEPGGMAYGQIKLKQERMVLRAFDRNNLPVVILRPPNVYGPYSAYTTGLIQRIRAGKAAIVDGGVNPCNLVYIDNLIEAILLSLSKPQAIGEVFFVTDPETVSWDQHIREHAALVGGSVIGIRSEDLRDSPRESVWRDSALMAPRVLLSGELRSLLRGIPIFMKGEELVYRQFQSLPIQFRQRVRLKINGPQRFPKAGPASFQRFDREDNLIAAQGRTVLHSSEKASHLLGYRGMVTRKQALDLTEAWLRYARFL